jgi:hypothetical protein
VAIVVEAARQAGRDPDTIGMEGRISQRPGATDEIVKHAQRWRDAGASHVSVNTMGTGRRSLDAHLDALTAAAAALEPA